MNELLNCSASELISRLAQGSLSSRELTQAHLDQIQAVNSDLNAVIYVDAEGAMEQAHRADEKRSSGEPLSPLHGLPMTHKDTHAVAGMPHTDGSPLFKNRVPRQHERLIHRLREAGVVSTGKTNVPEFGAGSHTFNEVFGTTSNPYDTSVSAGGSSGGVAAAIAARMQPLGEGSDMGGSLRIPASFCNVYGFRPSYGAIPYFPPHNINAWLTRQGPMARHVEDIQLFMRSVSGPTPELPTARSIDPATFVDSGAENLRGVRIAVTRDFGESVVVTSEMLEGLDRAVKVFEDLGAQVEEATIDFSAARDVFRNTRAYDFAANLSGLVASQRELIKPEVIWNVEVGLDLNVEDLIATAAKSAQLQRATSAFFEDFDLLLSPGAQLAPFPGHWRYPEEVAGQQMHTYLDWMESACLISATGLPTLAMPAGFTADGLPTGVQLTSPHYLDAQLLWWARAYDKATGWPSITPGMVSS